jgi:hypothetical protein
MTDRLDELKFSTGHGTFTMREMMGDSDEFCRGFEAGAASQAGTLRDEFAGQALVGLLKEESWMQEHQVARYSYEMADAMLEARKTTKEKTNV